MQGMEKTLLELFAMLKTAEVEIKKEHQVLMVNKTTSFKHAQGIITLHILFTTLNTTNWKKKGSIQKARKAIDKANLTQEPMRRWSTQSTTITSITCHGRGVYRDISRWYIGMMIKTIFTTKGIWQEVRIKTPYFEKCLLVVSIIRTNRQRHG